MKKVKIINKIIKHTLLLDYDRVYIGNDYCEYNLQKLNILKLLNYYKNKKITLILPFLTDNSFKILTKILEKVSDLKLKDFEVVFNDWGTFFYLRKYYPKIKLVLGRLLTKQKKDPRMKIILEKKQDVIKAFKLKDKLDIIHTKEVPKTLNDLFSRNVVESKELISFLLDNNIHRIEIDNLVWNMISQLPKKIKVSLYYPFMLLSVTRYCGALNNKCKNICNKDCLKNVKSLGDNLYIKGNALYYKNIVLPSKNSLKSNNVDRIIYQDL